MESSELWTLVITGVLALFGGAGFWGWWTNRGERPLRKKEVENATLTVVQDTYGDLLKDVRSEVRELRTLLKEQAEEQAEQGERITELEEIVNDQATLIHKLRRALQSALTWIDDVHLHWETYRLREAPPLRPEIPPHTEPKG